MTIGLTISAALAAVAVLVYSALFGYCDDVAREAARRS